MTLRERSALTVLASNEAVALGLVLLGHPSGDTIAMPCPLDVEFCIHFRQFVVVPLSETLSVVAVLAL